MHACTVVIVRVLISIILHIETFAHLMTFSSAVVCVCVCMEGRIRSELGRGYVCGTLMGAYSPPTVYVKRQLTILNAFT